MIAMQRILCPVDFSDTSRRALDHALALARWYGAAVSVLYVQQLSTPVHAAFSIVPEPSQPMASSALECEQLKAALDDYVAHDRQAPGVPIEAAVDGLRLDDQSGGTGGGLPGDDPAERSAIEGPRRQARSPDSCRRVTRRGRNTPRRAN